MSGTFEELVDDFMEAYFVEMESEELAGELVIMMEDSCARVRIPAEHTHDVEKDFRDVADDVEASHPEKERFDTAQARIDDYEDESEGLPGIGADALGLGDDWGDRVIAPITERLDEMETMKRDITVDNFKNAAQELEAYSIAPEDVLQELMDESRGE